MIPILHTGPQRYHSASLIRPAFDAFSGSNGNNQSSDTWTHTTGSGFASSCLIVLTAISAGSANGNSTTGVTYNGVALSPITGASGFSNSSTSRILKMWYLLNPSSGAHSVVTSFSTSSSINNACGAITLQHVNQSSPFGTAVETDGTAANSASVSVPSSASTDLIVAGIVVRNNPVTSGGSLTPRSSNSSGTSTYSQIATALGTGSNVTASYTWSSNDNYVLAGFAVAGATS